ncbi:hypothetical protein ABZ835_43195 [Streptomyces sp. NPDC047461]|uniref:hypothetical protein n=1 Tax=Streptomyces sp. NPDC047461 TaxID=3155619 RepID=UPI0033EBF84E
MKAAAERLLRAQAMSGEAVCSPPGPELALAGSVVWLRLGDGSGLTIHMTAGVRPDWETQPVARTVVEAKVLLDRFTLQRLPYVHRIRCDSQGTSRRVLMGTETARGTQWFTGDPCAGRPAKPAHRPTVGPRSRRTARSAGPDITRSPPPPAAPGHRTPEPRHHQHPKLIKECDVLLGRRTSAPMALKAARDSAEQWLERSKEVVTWGHKGERVVLTGDVAHHETQKRARQAQQATEQRKAYLEELALALEHERFGDVRDLLRAISQLPDSDVPLTRAQIDVLKGARARVYGGGLGKQDQVARKKWIERLCPTCTATPGQECFDDVPDGQPVRRFGGHDERLLLVIASGEKAAAHKRAHRSGSKTSRSSGTTTEDLARSVSHVPCPTCRVPAGLPCTVSVSHEARFLFAQAQRRP